MKLSSFWTQPNPGIPPSLLLPLLLPPPSSSSHLLLLLLRRAAPLPAVTAHGHRPHAPSHRLPAPCDTAAESLGVFFFPLRLVLRTTDGSLGADSVCAQWSSPAEQPRVSGGCRSARSDQEEPWSWRSPSSSSSCRRPARCSPPKSPVRKLWCIFFFFFFLQITSSRFILRSTDKTMWCNSNVWLRPKSAPGKQPLMTLLHKKLCCFSKTSVLLLLYSELMFVISSIILSCPLLSGRS